MSWTNKIPETEISERVTEVTVSFANEFGEYLAKKEDGNMPLTTTQLRRFFGEVKRQQLNGYDVTEFVMLKPKLAYAVGKAKKEKKETKQKIHYKIEDFNTVIADAIDCVERCDDKEKAFRNFIYVFEAIVAYHKLYEEK